MTSFLKTHDIAYDVIIEDVQQRIKAVMPKDEQMNLTSAADINYAEYNKFETVEAWLGVSLKCRGIHCACASQI